MEKKDIVKVLQQGSWFKGIESSVLDQIADTVVMEHVNKREFLFMPGFHREYVYCVLEGTVQLSLVGSAGEQFILATSTEAQWFGESSVFSKTKFLELQTITPCTLLKIPFASLQSTIGENSKFYRNVLETHMQRLQLVYELIAEMLFLSLRARLASRFVYLIELFGKPIPEGTVLDMKFSQQDFARMSMGSRQRVNKIFREWQASGIYEKKSGRYIIKDIEALKLEIEANDDA